VRTFLAIDCRHFVSPNLESAADDPSNILNNADQRFCSKGNTFRFWTQQEGGYQHAQNGWVGALVSPPFNTAQLSV